MAGDFRLLVAHGSVLDFPQQLMNSVYLIGWCVEQLLQVVSDDVTPLTAVALPI